MTNSGDSDQLASVEANWSGSTLFAKEVMSGFSRTRVKRRFHDNQIVIIANFVIVSSASLKRVVCSFRKQSWHWLHWYQYNVAGSSI